jgi:hypothetical protein
LENRAFFAGCHSAHAIQQLAIIEVMRERMGIAGMSHTCVLLFEVIGGGIGFILLFSLVFSTLNKDAPFRMDPATPDEDVGEVPNGFEPHLKRYQELAQLILTLATATVAFLVNFLAGIHADDKRGPYSIKLENACSSAIAFLALSAFFAISFILSENLAYETYSHSPRRDTYSAKWYATNISLGYSSILWFFVAYAYIAWRLLA